MTDEKRTDEKPETGELDRAAVAGQHRHALDRLRTQILGSPR